MRLRRVRALVAALVLGSGLLAVPGSAPSLVAGVGLASGGAAVAPTEESVAEGLEAAKRAIGEMIDFQLEFLSEIKAAPKPFEPKVLFSEETYQTVAEFAESRIEAALVTEKRSRDAAIDRIGQAGRRDLPERRIAQRGDPQEPCGLRTLRPALVVLPVDQPARYARIDR
mgnify:CR=1 FL=1